MAAICRWAAVGPARGRRRPRRTAENGRWDLRRRPPPRRQLASARRRGQPPLVCRLFSFGLVQSAGVESLAGSVLVALHLSACPHAPSYFVYPSLARNCHPSLSCPAAFCCSVPHSLNAAHSRVAQRRQSSSQLEERNVVARVAVDEEVRDDLADARAELHPATHALATAQRQTNATTLPCSRGRSTAKRPRRAGRTAGGSR